MEHFNVMSRGLIRFQHQIYHDTPVIQINLISLVNQMACYKQIKIWSVNIFSQDYDST